MHGLKGDYMNNIIIDCKWKVDFDKSITELYYRNYTDLCQCASCRNFYENTNLLPVDVRKFVEQFGSDVTKPIELESVLADLEQRVVEYTLYYAVNGTIELLEKSDLQLNANRINIVPKEISPNTDISVPYFVFAIHNIWLPWTIDDNIYESYN